MATLVNKIKDKVSHRRSGSAASHEAAGSPTGPSSDTYEDAQQYVTPSKGPTRVSLEDSAFHVHHGPSARMSVENDKMEYPVTRESSNNNRGGRNAEAYVGGVTSSKNGATSALPSPTHARHVSAGQSTSPPMPRGSFDNAQVRKLNGVTPGQSTQEVPNEVVPHRASSKHVNTADSTMQPGRRQVIANNARNSIDDDRALPPLPNTGAATDRSITQQSPRARVQNTPRDAYRRDSVTRKPLPGTPGQAADVDYDNIETAKQGRNEDLGLSAGLANMYLRQPQSHDAVEKADREKALRSGHLTLPEGFDVGDSVRTYVTEEQRPAVTHETIIRKRTEIFQEAITRDIHIHHYHTYMQPVEVVEVLPARHFHLDLKTGVKTEIQEPPGWQMPTNLTPRKADASMVKGWTRHYLVDEEHPRGVLEAPPLKHEHGHENLRAEPVVQQA